MASDLKDDDEPSDGTPPAMPWGVRAAATVWQIYGLFSMCPALIAAVVLGPWATVLFGSLGVAVFSGGLLARDGRFPCVRWPAVGSLTMGVAHLTGATVLAIAFWVTGPITTDEAAIFTLFWCPGFALLTAGGLALRDADAYKKWRAESGSHPP